MNRRMLAGLIAISLTGTTQSALGSEFLLGKAADFYCGSMEDMKPSEMSTYDRGLYEGMAIGFVAGQYPGQIGVFEKMNEKEINNIFYPLIKKKCPDKSFE